MAMRFCHGACLSHVYLEFSIGNSVLPMGCHFHLFYFFILPGEVVMRGASLFLEPQNANDL